MPTYIKSELVQYSPINEQQTLPTKSKHDLDQEYKKNHKMAIYQKELRKLDDCQMTEYQHDLTNALWNPYNDIKNNIINWDFRIISEDDALNTPRRKN